MKDSFQSAYQEEEYRLERTMEEVDRQLERLRNFPVYTGHDFTEQVLEAGREERRKALSKSAQQPYFGRLDFEEQGSGERKPLYIGKIGVDREEVGEHPLVIDWRAPVASLFYSFTGGEASATYEAPEGLIEGLVYLKRNVVIRQRILERVADTYNRDSDQPAVSDEFLVYRLGENKDNKLRDIVSTIQAEQDQIIRAARNTALIIQGVAGSGKTTVALHRLAFLLYQYKGQVSAEKMVIFAPNHMFLDYISDVLPELGVGDIQQRTFPDWAMNLLGLDMPLADASQTLHTWFETPAARPELNDEVPGRFKGSIGFMELIREWLSGMEAESVPNVDFSPWDGAVLSQQEIENWFGTEYKHYPLAKRKERVMARIHRWIEMELKKPMSETVRKERKKKAATREKAYAKKWPEYNPLTLYKQLFKTVKGGAVPASLSVRIPKAVMKQTGVDLKQDVIREEDLPALVYIHTLVNDIEGSQRFDHIVIDEAQDFSPFHVALLDQFVKGHSFTILGDLSQGIHEYRGVHAWEEMSSLFPEEQNAYFALTRSYRSTMEIIDYANTILEQGVKSGITAIPVFRSGDPVRTLAYGSEGRAGSLERALKVLTTKDYRTVSILTRTLHEAEELHRELQTAGWDLNLIDGGKKQYSGGHSILPVYLSKGLEFDAAIVADVDEQHYMPGAGDAKLLYVGCTRALHELWLFHDGGMPEYAAATHNAEGEQVTIQGWPDEDAS
ncbi:UvrD-helicase domain-containing protein [Paenibacillus barcinonensis]|uniref:DNA helicase-2/ATP-dependent DNA helicase PcrA n=1 Tax=Paenibacillus barcinonensis TaxID=198119 RepID=A0A2V4WDI8_PAEBA|nr:UvrD-helicase domain-containing protein [Paenibacillus barcinonensis]PYE49533.1 DNA helicase-2/ATP-dependent DNA helicase PcrA [Paenibacillus barcinonensis]QKS56740.1 UvrD-helicase domain-containing protein [Paenibacillus barcinonensis]